MEVQRSVFEPPIPPFGSGAAGLHSARGLVAHAHELLAGLAPGDWRSVSAEAFADRLADLTRDCAEVAELVADAGGQVRALETELAAGRDAVCVAGPWWAAR